VDAIDETAGMFRRAANWRFDIASILDPLEQRLLPSDFRSLPSVWAGDVMRFRGRCFDHLFALRMQDELFPQRRTQDPLLPDAERHQLGVREIGDGRDEER